MLAALKSWKWLERIICMGHHHPNSLQVWPTLELLNCKGRVIRLRGNFFFFFEGGIWLCLFFFHLFYVSFTTCILVCVCVSIYLFIYSFSCAYMDWPIFFWKRGCHYLLRTHLLAWRGMLPHFFILLTVKIKQDQASKSDSQDIAYVEQGSEVFTPTGSQLHPCPSG